MVDCLIHHASGDLANGTRVVEIVSTVGSAFRRRRNFVLPGCSGDAVAHLGCGLAGFVPGCGRGGFTRGGAGGGAGGGRGGFAEDGLGYVAGDGDQVAKDGKGGQDPPADELPSAVTPAVRVTAQRDVDLGLLLDLGRDVVLAAFKQPSAPVGPPSDGHAIPAPPSKVSETRLRAGSRKSLTVTSTAPLTTLQVLCSPLQQCPRGT